jgi:tRNA-dihydrouridine synthase B
VCNKWAGSALMQDEALAVAIAQAVVQACAPLNVPVTLKMRTGWSAQHRNAVVLARRFEDVGVQMLTVHGRTREQGYQGQAEYDTIAAVKAQVAIPVVANGDITSPQKAREVLACTGADAIMVGRAAQGRPWIFREIGHFLATGETLATPLVAEVRRLLLDHLQDHYQLYGEASGVRSARKHIGWYVRGLPGGEDFRQYINTIADSRVQWEAVAGFFDALGERMDRLPAPHDGLHGELQEQEGLTA